MIKDKIGFNDKKRIIAVTAAASVSLLVASIAAIGAAPLSDQQTSSSSSLRIGRGVITSALIADETIVSADLKDGAAVRSSDIVDGQVNTADLAPNAVTSDKIKNGEVKAEDLDPSVRGGTGGQFGLQTTERSKSAQTGSQQADLVTLSVQCDSDEVVTGGGYALKDQQGNLIERPPMESKKQDNGWSVTWGVAQPNSVQTVYAECLKIVNTGTTG